MERADPPTGAAPAQRRGPVGGRWGDALRAALLGAALLGLALLAVWALAPGWVQALDRRMVKSYTGGVDARLTRAEQWLEEGHNERAIEALEALLRDLEEVRKRDRLDARKRRALAMLTGELRDDHPERARAWYEHWLAFDPRDVRARIERAELLARSPETRAEALEELADLHRRIPEHPATALAYIAALQRGGRPAEALAAYRGAVRRFPWEISWTGGRGFAHGPRREVQPRWSGARLAFETALPPGAASVSVRPPAEVALDIALVSVRLDADRHGPPLDLLAAGGSPCAGGEPGSGGSEGLCWRLARPVPDERGAILSFRADVRAPLPPGLASPEGGAAAP